MNQYYKYDPWKIIEEGFNPEQNQASESIFSIGNGKMGQRANFEETYSGNTLQGNYIAGIYYPDKTRVGWWKNGYPEYFAKVLNAPNWIGIKIIINNEILDLAKCNIRAFYRELDMQKGILSRSFEAELKTGIVISVKSERFLSIVNSELGVIKYSIQILNSKAKVNIIPFIDADIVNEDSNYDEKFWDEVDSYIDEKEGYVIAKTKKTNFHVCSSMRNILYIDEKEIDVVPKLIQNEKFVAHDYELNINSNQTITIFKYAAIGSSMYFPVDKLWEATQQNLDYAVNRGYQKLKEEHIQLWAEKWKESDITIEGDVAAQQGIRFNIFQLNQTYSGEDERLNIGPKGFTGEKYGGSTYWDTEAYCLPFYLSTSEPRVAKNLLLYRFKQLDKAIENAEKLGFNNGAALFPMVTMNGEECHNEWEITFEEIHRNGAIAFAIYNYIRHTNETSYLVNYGLEVLIAISRFWAQRIHFSAEKKMYVMHGVTGPNEYENNVNNNWYTNKIAIWTLEYTLQCLDTVKKLDEKKYNLLSEKINFIEDNETLKWKDIVNNMFFPYHEEQEVFLQQEGYMDKEQILVKDLNPSVRPINQYWSWDRILRSCYIKQADVLQGIYLFENQYDINTIRKNFDFYEARTVHESSLSPCIHSILACKIGNIEKAYEFYLRTSRLDIDDYNNEVNEGLHITSMAGTWLSIVEGFGGMRIKENQLHFNPVIPNNWNSYSFKVLFRGSLLKLNVSKDKIELENQSDKDLELLINNNIIIAKANSVQTITNK